MVATRRPLLQASPLENKLLNPGFEEGLVNWTEDISGSVTATIAAVTTTVRDAAQALEIDVTASAGAADAKAISDSVDTQPGEVWSFSCWVNITSLTNIKARLRLRWSGGATVTDERTTLTSGWVLLSSEGNVAPAGTTSLEIQLANVVTIAGGTGTVYFDEVKAVKASSLP